MTDVMLLDGSRLSWITSDNCEVIAKILPSGFKDMNGKEIYEGDILSPVFLTCDPNDHRYENCKVYYDDGCFSVYCSDDYQPCLWEIDDTVTEVIGNIYENPELLKDDNQ